MAREKAKDKHEIVVEKITDLLGSIEKRENHGIVEYEDCPLCGGKKTFYYVKTFPNGSLQGGCTSCGLHFS